MAALLGVLALAGGLRLWGLGDTGLWSDEGFTAYVADRPITTHHRLLRDDTAPPLHFWLTRPAALLGPHSEFALRLPSALAGVLCVALVYALAVELLGSRLAGLTAAMLLATNRFHLIRSREARHYALYLALALAAMWCVARLARAKSRIADRGLPIGAAEIRNPHSAIRNRCLFPVHIAWLGFVLSAAGMVYTHNVGFFFLGGLLLCYPLCVWLRGDIGCWMLDDGPPASSPRPVALSGEEALARGSRLNGSVAPVLLRAAAASLLAGVAVGVLYLPWTPVLRAQLGAVMADYWISPPTLPGVRATLETLVSVGPNLPADFRGTLASAATAGWLSDGLIHLIWPVAVVGWAAWLIARRDRRAVGLLIGLTVATVGLIGFSLWRRPIFMDKVVIPLLVVPVLGSAALVALAMGNRPTRWLGVLLAVVLSGFATAVAVVHLGMEVNEQWREAAAWTLERADPGDDLLLVDDAHNLMAAEWYLADSPFGPVRWDSATPHLLAGGGSVARTRRTAPLNALPPQDLIDALAELARPGRRLWVIQRAYHDTLNPPVEAWLRGHAREVGREEFHVVRVRRFVFDG